MRSFQPDPSNQWPQDMAITVDISSGKLMFLLFVREAWNIEGVDLPGIDPVPAVGGSVRPEKVEADDLLAEWNTAWAYAVADLLTSVSLTLSTQRRKRDSTRCRSRSCWLSMILAVPASLPTESTMRHTAHGTGSQNQYRTRRVLKINRNGAISPNSCLPGAPGFARSPNYRSLTTGPNE